MMAMRRLLFQLLLGLLPLATEPFSAAVAPPVRQRRTILRSSTERKEEETTFIKCTNCDAVYVLTAEELGSPGRRVRCAICGNFWFQSSNRMSKLFDSFELRPYPEDRKNAILSGTGGLNEKPKRGRAGSTLFIANLSFDVDEDDLAELFEPVTPGCRVSVVRTEEGQSKGFGFVNVESEDLAKKAIDTLDGVDLRGRFLQ